MKTRSIITVTTLLILLTTGIIAGTGGNIGAAITPIFLFIALSAVIAMPLRWTAAALFTAVLLIHDPGAMPMSNQWQGPLYQLSHFCYDNLRHMTGINALKFNVFEACFVILALVIFVRMHLRNTSVSNLPAPASREMRTAYIVSLLSVLYFIIQGLATGGNQDQLLWQIRLLVWTPIIGFISMQSFQTDRDFQNLGRIVVGVVVIRIMEGAYFLYAVAIPRGVEPPFATTHHDTVIYVTAFIIVTSRFIETSTRRHFFTLLAVGGIILFGISINHRRIAYVSLAMSLIVVYAFIRPKVRFWINRGILFLLPALILYFIIGLHSEAAMFSPVHSLVSVTDGANSSNQMRKIENYNLIYTLRAHPLLGSGFGHEYIEISKGIDISNIMPNYRYIAHNSLLWLASLTGAMGLYLIWMYMPVAVFLAARAYPCAQSAARRTTAITVISIVIIYMVQAYGDMGVIGWMPNVILGVALGVAANLVSPNEETLPPPATMGSTAF